MRQIQLYWVSASGGPVDIPSGRIVDVRVDQPLINGNNPYAVAPMIQVRVETEYPPPAKHLQTVSTVPDGVPYSDEQKYQGSVSIQPLTLIN